MDFNEIKLFHLFFPLVLSDVEHESIFHQDSYYSWTKVKYYTCAPLLSITVREIVSPFHATDNSLSLEHGSRTYHSWNVH